MLEIESNSEWSKHGPINEPSTGCLSSIRKATLLLIFGFCVFASGCRDSPTSSAEAQSPNGKVVATAKTFANSGFGGGGPTTTFVYLNWTSGSQSPMEILCLTGGSDTSVDTNVGMKWLTPTHLELTYKGNTTVDFEAVKWAGIDITVRDLSGETTNTSH